ncbi:hypothetical protein P2C54_17070 [Xanthomonas perforans]|uniref:Uncharacterized protein n=1 Tax=Xanthomonas euvesicatoria TaxID=456327 RepID=A0AAX4FSB3_XANEU|nr:hypothetical protein [Xanthomonas euvesicatoria]MCC8915424.1 hypothetical protein [Xanthomonas euvesicatoria]MCE4329644.1 hypothetical protein [Xanthomonas campestris pv. coriandri]MDO7939695.1 hypothetical protein [Xanthomonas euvesicatoria pv. eucalypti]WOP58749.1 hypothetical protein R5577_09705 [Xanthomonas euvesicatoria]
MSLLGLQFRFWCETEKSTAFTPCGRESLFFACAKKSNQKKAHPVLAPSAPTALRVRKSGRNFCKGHPCPLQKRRASMRAALRVVSAGLAAAVWGPGEARSQSEAQRQKAEGKKRQAELMVEQCNPAMRKNQSIDKRYRAHRASTPTTH